MKEDTPFLKETELEEFHLVGESDSVEDRQSKKIEQFNTRDSG